MLRHSSKLWQLDAEMLRVILEEPLLLLGVSTASNGWQKNKH